MFDLDLFLCFLQEVEDELRSWNIDNVDTHIIGGGKYKKVLIRNRFHRIYSQPKHVSLILDLFTWSQQV